MNVKLIKQFNFEAAHQVPGTGEKGSRLHGHGFLVELICEGPVECDEGWLVDFGDIKRPFMPLLEQLDHSYINEIEGMDDPSPEGIAQWIKQHMAPHLDCLADVIVSVEGDNAYVPVELPEDPRRGLPKRIRFTFEAAQSLPQLPDEHPCKRLHGHSYRVEIGAGDLQRLEPHVRALYDALDHRSLNDIEGLDMATCEVICGWMWQRLSKDVPDLNVIVVQETDTARCIHYGK